MKRKQQKRKDPVEALIGKISEKVEAEFDTMMNSLNNHIENAFKPKPKTADKINYFKESKPFTMEFGINKEETKFQNAKDITPKVRQRT